MPDLPEMGGRTAGPNLPSTRAGGQDDGSYTNSLKISYDMISYDMMSYDMISYDMISYDMISYDISYDMIAAAAPRLKEIQTMENRTFFRNFDFEK